MLKNINKTFLIVYTGQAISQLTSSILQMAIVWYLITETNSSNIVALSGIVGFLPQGVLGLFIGVFIDRFDRKKIMIISDLLIAAASLSLSVSGFFGEISIPLIMIVLFIRSVGTAFHVPSLQAITPLIVSKDELPKYSGYSQTLQSISLLLSPVLASFFFSIWSLQAIVMLDVLGAIIGVFTLCIVTIPKIKIDFENTKIDIALEMKEGIATLKKNRLFNFMLLGAAFSIVYIPIFVLYPMMTLSYFGKNQWYAGAIEVVFAIGMLIGSLVLGATGGGKRKIVTIAFFCFIIGISLSISGILGKNMFIGFALCSTLLGFATPFYQGLQVVVFQQKIQEKYLGRVMSLSGSLMAIGTPIGIGLSGIISDKIGVENFFLYSGILIIFISILYLTVQISEKSRK
ncbi:MFS transporter [Cetobacterium somerae]|uniref:MFS transporter n=1 Tax=Cetobacterium somerae TaxID=188913 RepID=UPI002E7B43A2|nr:MFS transporter [Cetobacterium somerae]WVJ01909.1 MFS transporter [Cetobacterium somerae]